MKFQALFIISIALCIGLIQAKALSKSAESKDVEEQEITKDQAKRWYGYGRYGLGYPYYGFYGKRETEEDKAISKDHSRSIFDAGMFAVDAFSGFGRRNTEKLIDSKDEDGQEITKDLAKRYWYDYSQQTYPYLFGKRNIR